MHNLGLWADGRTHAADLPLLQERRCPHSSGNGRVWMATELVGPAIGERVDTVAGVIAVCNLDDEPAASYCLGGSIIESPFCRCTSPCHPKLLMQLVLMMDTAVRLFSKCYGDALNRCRRPIDVHKGRVGREYLQAS